MAISIAAVVASPSAASRTLSLVETVLAAAREEGALTELVNISALDIAAADGRKAEEYEGDTARVLAMIDSADAVVFGMPVYRAGIPGSMKNLLDIVPRGKFDGDAQALRAKPVVVVATGASDHHFLALDSVAEMMRGFFSAYVVPPGVYASHGDFSNGELASQRVIDGAERSGRALVALASAISASDRLRAVEPLV